MNYTWIVKIFTQHRSSGKVKLFETTAESLIEATRIVLSYKCVKGHSIIECKMERIKTLL